jgi:hypothetical protein
MNPFFSILVPVYNHEKFVGLALDSLLAQTDPDWEACVIDDGSTDGTPAILDEYARRDPRIRVFHKQNGGEASALNAAWRETKGVWIGWLSSDDLFLPDKLAVHREWIKQFPDCRYFFTDFQTLDNATGALKNGYVARTPEKGRELLELLAANYINGITMCVHREVFEAVGAFDEITRHGQDYDFHLRAVAHYAPIRIPQTTCVQRTHPGQMSQQHARAMFYDCAVAAIRFLNTVRPGLLMGSVSGCTVAEVAQKLDQALSVAAAPDSYLNLIGPHPAMAMHLVLWAAETIKTDRTYRSLVDVIGSKSRAIAWAQSKAPNAGFWQALSVMCDLSALPSSVDPVLVEDVIDAAWFWASARGDEQAEVLAEYAANRQRRQIKRQFINVSFPLIPVVWIPLVGKVADGGPGLLQVVNALAESGVGVVVLRRGQPAMTWRRGILTVSVPNPKRAMLSLAATPGAPVVLLLPGQQGKWWWRQIWAVVEFGGTNLAGLSKELSEAQSPSLRRRLCAMVIRQVGRCVRLGACKCRSC